MPAVDSRGSLRLRPGSRALFLVLFCLSTLGGVPSAGAAGSRDILWGIVSHCLDPGVADYCGTCRSPRVETNCAAKLACADTTEVWAENEQFVVLRDRKMCGCAGGFVHALVVPRARITGVEDPKRPDGIWEFAWSEAQKRLGGDRASALVVNPAGDRGQDQLHVHILRLKEDARRRFAKAPAARVPKLDEVWAVAGKVAAAAGLADYGILVTALPEGGFLVVVDPSSPEKDYALERCR